MKRRQDPKIKLTVYVSRMVAEHLDLACKDRTKNKSKLTETALAQLLNPRTDDQQEAALPRRLDRLTRDVRVIHRHQQIAVESFGMFLRHYLMTAPLLPHADEQASVAMGHQRFQRFVEQLGRKLASTTTFAAEITDQFASHAPKSSTSAPDTAKPTAHDVTPKPKN